MKFIADLHIHSLHSIATSRKLDLEHLHVAAQRKGIRVVATGDVTHPGWFEQVRERLVPAEPGLYRLNEDAARACDRKVPESCRSPVRFLLSTEISNVYKKEGRTRKNHNLVYLPDRDAAERFNRRLETIGNIHSDGRPILGLDARDLLEIVLETSDRAFLIPAHIWTPWFSVLGSKSGFDSLHDCFGDLTPHIFAVETGLSSDPQMNWRVSFLDGLTLVSNSDAHSPMKLGREANRFDTECTFDDIREALRSGDPRRFLGTFEFYPQEGKYHYDGHRKCAVRSDPEETRRRGGRCPRCGKPLTCGVLHRVEELADRPKGHRPEGAHPFVHLVPLESVLGEIFQVGTGSKKVATAYRRCLQSLGSEFSVLRRLPLEEIAAAGIPLLAEAIGRIRSGAVDVAPGYDGEFGTVRIFDEEERKRLSGQKTLFSVAPAPPDTGAPPDPPSETAQDPLPDPRPRPSASPDGPQLNARQQEAAQSEAPAVIVVAGPGTGKTLTLAHRIVHAIREQGTPSERIAAVTFTQKAAEEMRSRLQRMGIEGMRLPFVGTLHGLCIHLLEAVGGRAPVVLLEEREREKAVAEAVRIVRAAGHPVTGGPRRLLERISKVKIRTADPDFPLWEEERDEGFRRVFQRYRQLLCDWRRMDFDDLVMDTLRLLEGDAAFRDRCRRRFSLLLVDEYQDLDDAQYRLIRNLKADDARIFAIGDPDQSIYGFRGSSPVYFRRFSDDFEQAAAVRLLTNYRSADTLLEAAHQVLPASAPGRKRRVRSEIPGKGRIRLIEAGSGRSEAVAIGKIIESAVGGSGFHAVDFDRVEAVEDAPHRGFSDFAVLVRTTDQLQTIHEVLEKAGIPTQTASRKHALEHPAVAAILSLLRFVSGHATPIDLEPIAKTALPRKTSVKAQRRFLDWCLSANLVVYDGVANARRIPIPGMVASEQEKLVSFFAALSDLRGEVEGLPVREALALLLEKTGLRQRFAADAGAQRTLGRLMERSGGHGTDSASFLSSSALQTDVDWYDPAGERVALMTLHASKGLEFPVVFIAGFEKGWVPMEPGGKPCLDEPEERRLLFVAMTRAREELVLSWSRKRRMRGEWVSRQVSPFLEGVDSALVERVLPDRPAGRRRGRRQLSLF